jgi:hypothetical protein
MVAVFPVDELDSVIRYLDDAMNIRLRPEAPELFAEELARARGDTPGSTTPGSTTAGSPALGSPTSRGVSPITGEARNLPDTPAGEGMQRTGSFVNDRDPSKARHRKQPGDSPRAMQRSIARARARRDGKLESETSDNIYRIIQDMARRVQAGAPGLGRSRRLNRYLGFWRSGQENIRLQKGSFIATMAHELGHHLQKALFPFAITQAGEISSSAFPKAWRPELVQLGKDLYGDEKPTGGYAAEGWAETVAFLVFNPKHLKEHAPTVYKDVVRLLVSERPDVWLTLLDARVRALNAIRAAQINPVRQYIARGNQRRDWLNLQNLWDSFAAKWLNRNQRLQTMLRDLGLENIPENHSPYISALRVTGHISGDLKLMMEQGTFDPADPTRAKTGPSLAEVLEPVRKKPNRELWEDYMVARRALEKRQQVGDPLPQDPRLPSLTRDRDLQRFIRETEELHPEFGDFFRRRGAPRVVRGPNGEPVRDEDGEVVREPTEAPDTVAARFREFNNWLIKRYAVHYGLVDSEAADLITRKNLEYITFRHKKTEDALQKESGARSSRGGGFVNQGSGIRRFRLGLGEQIFPPLDSFAGAMQGIVSRARLNEVGQQVVQLWQSELPGVGRWMDKIDRPMDAMRVSADQLSAEVQEQMGITITKDGQVELPPYLEDLTEDQLADLIETVQSIQGATFWRPGTRTDRENREVWVLQDGKPQFYEIKDRRMFELLEGLGSYGTNLLVKILAIPGRTLRAGATQYNPSFFIPNFMRDTMQALTMTDSEMRQLEQQTRLRIEGMRDAFFKGDWYNLFLASGADMAGLFGEYYNPLKAKIDIEGMGGSRKRIPIVKGDTPKQIAKDIVKLGGIDRLNQSFELANRLGEFAVVYEQSKQQGMGEAQAVAKAGQAAADITVDFQRGGKWAKEVNELIVFFNVAILGTDKLGRFIKKHPVKSAARIFTLTLVPSIIQFLLNWDNEDFWAKPLEQRDRHWYFPTGYDANGRPTYLKMPKPYGLAVFSIAAERSLAAAFAINPEDGESRGDPGAFNNIIGAMIRELRPTFNIAGLQPIVEVMAGDRGWSFFWNNHIVSAADQDLPLHMQGADRSSSLARVLGDMLNYPPAKIDYLINGFFGGLGSDVVSTLIDPAIEMATPGPAEGEPMRFDDYLIIRRFLAGTTRGQHEAITRFYDTHERLKRINAGYNAIKDDPQERRRYYQRHESQLVLWKKYSRTQRAMREDFSRIRSLYERRDTMDPDRWDRMVQEQYDRLVDRAQEAHQTREVSR